MHTKKIVNIIMSMLTALRKLTNRRKEVDGTLQRRNIIDDYNNYSSQVSLVVVYSHMMVGCVGLCS